MIGYEKNIKKPTIKVKIGHFILTVIVPVLFLAFWEFAVSMGWARRNLTPPPSSLWATFLNIIETGELWETLAVSFYRVMMGFLIGGSAGIILGFGMGLFQTMNRLLTVMVSVLRPIPVIALIPVFIVLMGLGEKSNISVIVVGAFFPVLVNTIAGVRGVDPKLLEVAYLYRLSRMKVVFQIFVPSAISFIITGVRLGMGAAWTCVVAAEMIGASSGIGYRIMYAREMAMTRQLYVYVLVIGIVGLSIDRILIVIEGICNKKFRGIVK